MHNGLKKNNRSRDVFHFVEASLISASRLMQIKDTEIQIILDAKFTDNVQNCAANTRSEGFTG